MSSTVRLNLAFDLFMSHLLPISQLSRISNMAAAYNVSKLGSDCIKYADECGMLSRPEIES